MCYFIASDKNIFAIPRAVRLPGWVNFGEVECRYAPRTPGLGGPVGATCIVGTRRVTPPPGGGPLHGDLEVPLYGRTAGCGFPREDVEAFLRVAQGLGDQLCVRRGGRTVPIYVFMAVTGG